MTTFRLRFLPLALAMFGLTLGSCKKDDAQPQTTITAQQQQLATGSWRLDEIKQDGQVTDTGAAIKDRYSLTFRTDGTYTQKLLADNTTYNGTWALMSNNSVLHLTDHKGDSNDYNLTSLTTTQLRYTYSTKTSQLEERTFSAQP